MVLNDFTQDVKERCNNQSNAAYGMGISRQLFNARIKWATITKGYVEMMEALGFDLEVVYSKGSGRCLNDFREDIKKFGGAWEVAKVLGLPRHNVYSKVRSAELSRGMRAILAYLGYDYEVRYVKR